MTKSDFKSMTDSQLYMLRDGKQGWSKDSADAKSELDRRQFWRKFWTHGLAAWIALVISAGSLVVSIISLVISAGK